MQQISQIDTDRRVGEESQKAIKAIVKALELVVLARQRARGELVLMYLDLAKSCLELAEKQAKSDPDGRLIDLVIGNIAN